MKELTSHLVSTLVKGDTDNAKAIFLSKQGLGFILSGSVTSKNHLTADAIIDPSFTVVMARQQGIEKKRHSAHSSPIKENRKQKTMPTEDTCNSKAHFTLPLVSIIDASNNELARVDELWDIFPSAWWVNLSSNKISAIEPDKWPLALGELNISSNAISTTTLFRLSSCHIMRIKIDSNPINSELLALIDAAPTVEHVNLTDEQRKTFDLEKKHRLRRLCLIVNLPNLWVINDDFVSAFERNRIETAKIAPLTYPVIEETDITSKADLVTMDDNIGGEGDNELDSMYPDSYTPKLPPGKSIARLARDRLHAGWATRPPNEKATNLINMLQSLPLGSSEQTDAFKLDVLLEDYLEEAWLWNKHAFGLLAAGDRKRMPAVDLLSILHMPHNARLDLSVLLTVSIVFPLPRNLLIDTLFITLSGYIAPADIDELLSVPPFIRTALVSLIRRISRREKEELQTLGYITDKPLRVQYPHLAHRTTAELFNASDPVPSSYCTPAGFTFLQPILEFLQRPLLKQLRAPSSRKLSSPLEFTDIELEILRNLPDVITSSTRPINPATSYRDWLAFASRHAVLLMTRSQYCPSLTRAQVTISNQEMYAKLEPVLTAASMTYHDLELTLTGPEKDGRVEVHQNSAAFVPFGTGLPKGQKHHLLWNKKDLTIIRGYRTPWTEKTQGRPEEQPNANGEEDNQIINDHTLLNISGAPTKSATLGVVIQRSRSGIRELSQSSTPTLADSIVNIATGSAASAVVRSASLHSTVTKEFLLPQLPGDDALPMNWSPARSEQAIGVGSTLEHDSDDHDVKFSSPRNGRLRTHSSGIGNTHSHISFNLSEADVSLRSSEDLHGNKASTESGTEKRNFVGSLESVRQADSSVHLYPGQLQSRQPQLKGTLEHNSSQRSPVSSRLIAKQNVVRGFTVDAAWDAAFLLAPLAAIRQHNNKTTEDLANRWSSLHEVPVLLHPSSAQMIPNIIKDASNDEIRDMLRSASDDISHQSSTQGETDLNYYKETPAEAARRLLAEMGTLRNIRHLGGSINSGVVAAIAGEIASRPLKKSLRQGSTGLRDALHPVLGALLLNSSGSSTGEKNHNVVSNTYLTDLPEHGCSLPETVEEGIVSRAKAPRSAPFRQGPSKFEMQDNSKTADLRRYLTSSLSSTDVMRMRLKYPHLFSPIGIGRANAPDVATSGRTLHTARFPCFNKIMYTLDKNELPFALMNIAEDAEKDLISPNITHAEDNGAQLAPSLFQNSELTLQAAIPRRIPPLQPSRVIGVGTNVPKSADPPITLTDSVLGFSTSDMIESQDSREEHAVGRKSPKATNPIIEKDKQSKKTAMCERNTDQLNSPAPMWTRQLAKPTRPIVYREDPNEQEGQPLRARVLTVAHPASARLPLNASFRVTCKPPPVPVQRISGDDLSETGSQQDSICRFNAQGKRQTC